MTPQIGVVALRIEARPLAMCLLAPAEQDERDHVVEQREDQDRAPHRARQARAARRRQRRNSHRAAAAIVSRSQT